MDTQCINTGVLQASIMNTKRAKHQTHSKDVQQATRHLNINGIWINGGTDEAGRHVQKISIKELRTVKEFLAAEEREIARKYQTRALIAG